LRDLRRPALSILVTVVLLLFDSPAIQLSTGSSSPVIAPNLVAGPNLLLNPGFEHGLVGWSASQGTAVYTSDSVNRSGCCSAKGIGTGQRGPGLLYQDVTRRTSPGGQYQVSGWVKIARAGGNATLGLDYIDGGQAVWLVPKDGRVVEMSLSPVSTQWTFFESSPVTLPPMPTDASALWFFVGLGSGNGTVWFDDVSLVQVTPLPSYIVAAVPMTIANNQTEPTASPFQEKIDFNSSLFASYEANRGLL